MHFVFYIFAFETFCVKNNQGYKIKKKCYKRKSAKETDYALFDCIILH